MTRSDTVYKFTDIVYSVEEIKSKCIPVFASFNLIEVNLFGSYAKNSATKFSDVDLLINAEDRFDLIDLSKLIDELSSVLQKEVDIVIQCDLKKDFYDMIRKDLILLYDNNQRHGLS